MILQQVCRSEFGEDKTGGGAKKNDESSDRFVRESMLFRHETSVGEICGHWPCQKKPNLSARHRHVNRYDEPVQEQVQISATAYRRGGEHRGEGRHVYLKLCLRISLLSSPLLSSGRERGGRRLPETIVTPTKKTKQNKKK